MAACQEEIVPEVFQPRDDHQGYAESLKRLGLEKSALGQDWISAAEKSLAEPHTLEIPNQEEFYFSDEKADALSYRFTVNRGEKILIEITPARIDTTPISIRLFIDLFREDPGADPRNILVASADINHNQLAFEPKENAFYLLRIQPELLRGGRFTLNIFRGPSLNFPVVDGENRDIGSFFGDPRPNYRKHHGVDIFAKRHTPIIAPCDGHIRFAGTRGLGGKVVWMRNQSKKLTLYFAHLQEIWTADGANIEAGDTLGTVGNTGNAITTPPHLHFGIYADGPIDPYHFVAHQKNKMKSVQANPALLGTIVRTRRPIKLHISPEEEISLPRYQWLEIYGVLRNNLRVKLPNGDHGMLSASDVEHLDQGIEKEFDQEYLVIEDGRRAESSVVGNYSVEQAYEVLARDDHYWYVRTAADEVGWVAEELDVK